MRSKQHEVYALCMYTQINQNINQQNKTIMKKMLIYACVVFVMLACTEQNAPEGGIGKSFSIAPNQRVYFSKGCLQYQATTNIWRFAENQYDIIGEDNRNISSTYSGWIDLFGWGTGYDPTNASGDDADYATFRDWGDNVISNGGNKEGLWRTLTKDEWEYLINGRKNADVLKGKATVREIRGLILLPDSWKGTKDIEFEASQNNWKTNDYSVAEWHKLEAAGAVFLPITGIRSSHNISGVDDEKGRFWSATQGNATDAYYFIYTDSNNGYTNYSYRHFGLPVRLVQDVQ